jgi:hypothetical protein
LPASNHPQIGRTLQHVVCDRKDQRVLAKRPELGELCGGILLLQATRWEVGGSRRRSPSKRLPVRKQVGCARQE